MAESPVRSNMDSPDASVLSGKKSRKQIFDTSRFLVNICFDFFSSFYMIEIIQC